MSERYRWAMHFRKYSDYGYLFIDRESNRAIWHWISEMGTTVEDISVKRADDILLRYALARLGVAESSYDEIERIS